MIAPSGGVRSGDACSQVVSEFGHAATAQDQRIVPEPNLKLGQLLVVQGVDVSSAQTMEPAQRRRPHPC
jgi:hypothetical protein